jgi:NADH-quinone oxidoreductase subunit C
MKTPELIFDRLKSKFPDAVLEISNDLPTEPVIIIDPLKIHLVSEFLRDNQELKFEALMNLSGVDDANGEKVKDENDNDIIQGGTLSIYYHLHSISLRHKITLKVTTTRDNPKVESVESIWKTADWHEREVYDLFGITFLNHPNLIRILMPYDWDAGFPLRKDYQNPEFYKGMKVPY